MNEVIVIALGGNAILRAEQKGTIDEQRMNIIKTATQIRSIIKSGKKVIITHGNGPQIGNILIQQEKGARFVPPMPMDVCGAQSQGQIGYMIQQSLLDLLKQDKIGINVVTIITQVLVDPKDPAFSNPTKPVGPFYTEKAAKRQMKTKGGVWIEDAGRGWRQVVPSPNPLGIIERCLIQKLVKNQNIVIACGGGGIPVTKDENGALHGVEAVIDKDLAAACLAGEVGADTLLILTNISKVALFYKTPQQKYIDFMTAQEARRYLDEGHFLAGSMGPKVEACVRFVENGGKRALIASLDEAVAALAGHAGTIIVNT